jgi:hypothetical protein
MKQKLLTLAMLALAGITGYYVGCRHPILTAESSPIPLRGDQFPKRFLPSDLRGKQCLIIHPSTEWVLLYEETGEVAADGSRRLRPEASLVRSEQSDAEFFLYLGFDENERVSLPKE